MTSPTALTKTQLQPIIDASAKLLGHNYDRYWPKKGLPDPNERDLTLALGSILIKEGYAVFCEVPDHCGHARNQDGRIDLMAITPGNDFVMLVESKNIASPKQRSTVEADFLKMKKFRPVHRNDWESEFPSKCLRMALLMGWTGDGMDGNPFLNPSYQPWLARLMDDPELSGLEQVYSTIPATEKRKSLRLPEYTNQWLMALYDQFSLPSAWDDTSIHTVSIG